MRVYGNQNRNTGARRFVGQGRGRFVGQAVDQSQGMTVPQQDMQIDQGFGTGMGAPLPSQFQGNERMTYPAVNTPNVLGDPEQNLIYDKTGNIIQAGEYTDANGNLVQETILTLPNQEQVTITQPEQPQQAPAPQEGCSVPVSNMTFIRDTQIVTGPKRITNVSTDRCGNTMGFTEEVDKTAVTGDWRPKDSGYTAGGLPVTEYGNFQYGVQGQNGDPNMTLLNGQGAPSGTGYTVDQNAFVGRRRGGQVGRWVGQQVGSTQGFTRSHMMSHRGA